MLEFKYLNEFCLNKKIIRISNQSIGCKVYTPKIIIIRLFPLYVHVHITYNIHDLYMTVPFRIKKATKKSLYIAKSKSLMFEAC